uniref:Integrin alpha-M-like n=1 Tax=Sphenodon punctatus TaxID=8508 RepID=A0A8D0GRR5_SPHPU
MRRHSCFKTVCLSPTPQSCTEDTLNPLVLRVNYTLTGLPIANTRNLRPILSQDSPQNTSYELHFEKNCGTDSVCEDKLQMSFNFSGLATLVVGLTPELNITVHIQNSGEDSYSTVIHFRSPQALSYRKVALLQSNRKALAIKCSSATSSRDEAERNSSCAVNHPIFWGGAEAVFVATFDVAPDADLGDRLQVTGNAHSENGLPMTPAMSHHAELPIKYAIYVIVTSTESSTKYVNFSAGQEGASQSVVHRYEVKNLRERSIPVSLTLQFPVKLNGIRIWDPTHVALPETPQLVQCTKEELSPHNKDFVKQMKERPLLDCSVAVCQKVSCSISSLRRQQPLEFTIKGNVSFAWLSQTQQQKVTLLSTAKIEYNQAKYTQKEGFTEQQVQTVVERIEVYNYLPMIIGASVGGLILLALITAALYKLGFFKRQYKQMMEKPVDEDTGGDGASQTCNTPNQ